MSHARQLLDFFYAQQICPVGYSMLLKDSMYPYVLPIKAFPSKEQEELKILSQSSPLCSASEIFEQKDKFIVRYHDNHYGTTVIKSADHTLRALFLFLDINDFNYHPKIADIWLSRISTIVGPSVINWRRALKLFEYYMTSKEFSFNQKCSYNNRMENYPVIFKNAVNGYLDWLKKSFHSDGTVRTYKYSVWSL